MDKLSVKGNFMLTAGKEMREICKPLNDHFGITSFNYVRTYDDGSQINLANTPEWLEYFYENKYHMMGAFEKHPKNYQSGYALWPQLSGQKIFYDARTFFNIDNGITIIEKKLDSCEFYYFGTTTDNKKIINFYINHMDLLKNFILYFKDRATPLIEKSEKNKIIIPDHFENEVQLEKEKPIILNAESIKKFLQDTKVKKFHLSGELEGSVLTYKQLKFVLGLIEGKTAKGISKKLGLSFRTVQHNLDNLKDKFLCDTKSELIEKLLKNGLGIYGKNCNIII